MGHYHLQGYAQLLQTAIVMVFALLNVATYGRRAYSNRGWWIRLLAMVVVFVVLGAADLWLNGGAGSELDNGIGTGLHYNLLILVTLITLGTFVATFRATVRNSKEKSSARVAG
jgi:hypothetical protein